MTLSPEEEPQLRWTTRERRPSTRYLSSEYILIADEGDLERFKEAQSQKDKGCWTKVIKELWCKAYPENECSVSCATSTFTFTIYSNTNTNINTFSIL